MSLDKAIEHGKEKRRPYRGSKAFDCSCRNHGGCPYCEESRQRKQKQLLEVAEQERVTYVTEEVEMSKKTTKTEDTTGTPDPNMKFEKTKEKAKKKPPKEKRR